MRLHLFKIGKFANQFASQRTCHRLFQFLRNAVNKRTLLRHIFAVDAVARTQSRALEFSINVIQPNRDTIQFVRQVKLIIGERNRFAFISFAFDR